MQNLAEFVKKTKPDLYAEIFPPSRPDHAVSIEQSLADIYPRYLPFADVSRSLQARQEEPADVKQLRGKAQDLTESIHNFIALQTTTYGGMRIPPQPRQYEVRVIDGEQRFREYPDGTKELGKQPMPDVDPILGIFSEWSMMPALLGTDLNLKIVQAKDVVMGEKRVKVFQYYGAVEDEACKFMHIEDFILFSRSTLFKSSCGGEVWTDEELNIFRISETYDLPSKAQWKNLRAVANYGWLERPGETARLIPINYIEHAELNGKDFWCRERFTNYRVFTINTRFLH
jgi:hypothetical protein